MAKCLRCGSGNEWIEGEARPTKTRDDGMPASVDERRLRRLLAVRSGIPHLYCDDGEASGVEHGIVIDFMRDSVADLDAKLLALNMARFRAAEDNQKTPNVSVSGLQRPARKDQDGGDIARR